MAFSTISVSIILLFPPTMSACLLEKGKDQMKPKDGVALLQAIEIASQEKEPSWKATQMEAL